MRASLGIKHFGFFVTHNGQAQIRRNRVYAGRLVKCLIVSASMGSALAQGTILLETIVAGRVDAKATFPNGDPVNGYIGQLYATPTGQPLSSLQPVSLSRRSGAVTSWAAGLKFPLSNQTSSRLWRSGFIMGRVGKKVIHVASHCRLQFNCQAVPSHPLC